MLWRISFSCCWQLAGGGLGWWQAGPGRRGGRHLLPGRGVVWDLRGARVLRWFAHRATWHRCRSMRGIWGEEGTVPRRLLRKQERADRDSQDRLQEILAACRPPPNGVVLLMPRAASNGATRWRPTTLALTRSATSCAVHRQLAAQPGTTAYFAAKDFYQRRGAGRAPEHAVPARILISVHLHLYGDGRTAAAVA